MLGVIIITDLGIRLSVFEAMHSDAGLSPLSELESQGRGLLNLRHFSLHFLHSSDSFQLAMFGVAGLCAVALILGWKTRVMAIACWVLHISLATRSPFYGSGEIVALNVILFWAMYLPLGECFSLDRRLGRGRAKASRVITLTGSVGFLVHVCLIYLCMTYAKGISWRDGHALMPIMHVEMVATEFGHSLTQFPRVLRILTSSVFYIEGFAPLLLFLPVFRPVARGLCCILFIGMHGGIAATCSIGLFPYISMVMWLPFVPGEFWALVGRVTGFSTGCVPDPEAESKVRSLPATQGYGLPRWVCYFPTATAVLIAGCTLLSAVIYAAPGVRRICDVAPVNAIVEANLSFTKIQQRWGLFIFGEKPMDGWFVVEGTLPDGSKVDLLRDMAPVDWSKPPMSGPRRLSGIWRTYLNRQEKGEGRNLGRFTAWLNHRFQRERGDGQTLSNIQVVFMAEPAPVSGRDVVARKVILWSGRPASISNDRHNGS